MRILISAIHYPVAAGRYLAEAFRRLGHDVTTVGPAAGGHLPWAPDKDFSAYAWTPDVELPMSRIYPLDDALGKAGGADLIIQCDANHALVGKFLSPCPVVCWAIDNHVAPYDETQFDLFFGAHSWGYGSDRKDFHWLPCAYDPQAHFQIPDAPKHFDVACIGVMYPKRVELVQALAQQGSVLVGQGVLGKEYNEAYNSARIALVQSSCGDVPMRLFENAAQGLTILCDRQRDLGLLGLREGTDYMCYESVEQAIFFMQYAKEHPDGAQWMANNAKAKLAAHTYEARARLIIYACKEQGLL